MKLKTRILLLGLVALLIVVLPGLRSAGAAPAAGRSGAKPVAVSPGPGCRPTQAALAHQSGGIVMHPQPAGAPIPCAVVTGYGGSETRVVVTADDALVYEPAILTPGAAGTGFAAGSAGLRPSTSLSPGGLAVSRNRGASWRFVRPSGLTWVPQDDQLYVDRSTGRIFYYALSPDPAPQGGGVAITDQAPAGYAHLLASADDGKTWTQTAIPGFAESENPRFASAPPPPGGARPADYPDVVYWCGNNMLFTETYRVCYHSLDGGLTWSPASVLFSQPVPRHAECGTNPETFNATDGNYPEAGPDGALYVLVSCGPDTFLARSRDEGATWPILRNGKGAPLMVPAAEELRVDPAGNLYTVHLDGANRLLLRVSRDGGLTWSVAQNLTAPGVVGVNEWFMAQRGRGEVAVSYLGQSAAQAKAGVWNGYLTVTRDGLSRRPTFWSAIINAPGAPLYVGSPAPARDDFIGADIGPDGTPWASFFASCPASSTEPACAGQAGNPQANAALAGRLRFP